MAATPPPDNPSARIPQALDAAYRTLFPVPASMDPMPDVHAVRAVQDGITRDQAKARNMAEAYGYQAPPTGPEMVRIMEDFTRPRPVPELPTREKHDHMWSATVYCLTEPELGYYRTCLFNGCEVQQLLDVDMANISEARIRFHELMCWENAPIQARRLISALERSLAALTGPPHCRACDVPCEWIEHRGQWLCPKAFH